MLQRGGNKSSFVSYSVCTADFLKPNCARTLEIKLKYTSAIVSNVQVRPERMSKLPSLEEIDILYKSSFQSISSRLVVAAIKYIQVKISSIRNCWTLQQMSHGWAIINRGIERRKKNRANIKICDQWGKNIALSHFIANNYSLSRNNRCFMLLESLINKTIKKWHKQGKREEY